MHPTNTPVGSLVIITEAHGNALLPSFPGWGEDLEICKQHMRPIVDGEQAEVVGIESHGMNPWTRFTLRFADGARASGVNPADVWVTSRPRAF